MPQGLGRYGIENASSPTGGDKAFEWYLKNHLGSTMAVYRTTETTAGPPVLQSAFDYRSFGEKIDLTVPTDKVTENFTGKELDDETELGYWGARYLDLMLGMWTSVDSKRQFNSPYLYAGNGMNPVNVVDPDGNVVTILLSNELAGKNSYVNKYTANEVSLGQSREPQVVPLYNMYVRNSSGSSAVFPVTRDAVAGNGPFNVDGSYGGNIRRDGKMGFRIELTDLETGTPTIVDQNGIKRSHVQIHVGPGCSKGCSLLQEGRDGRANFESTIENMIQEDVDNNKGDNIYVDTEKFIPFDAQ
jgi:RHS repeat-associated protein